VDVLSPSRGKQSSPYILEIVMTESTAPSMVRSASRQTAPPKPAASLVFDPGLDGLIITVTGDKLDARRTKNGLERFIRLLRKVLAAGITDTNSLTGLLAEVAEAKRLKKATKEANDRINRVLVKPTAEPQASQTMLNSARPDTVASTP
jgi:hypothetical protein